MDVDFFLFVLFLTQISMECLTCKVEIRVVVLNKIDVGQWKHPFFLEEIRLRRN